jgi:phage gpG-like protein
MNETGDNLQAQFEAFAKEALPALRKFPLLAANEGKNFFVSRFKAQNWIDHTTEPWKKRKPTASRNRGRATLTDTGNLKRSIRIISATWDHVEVGTDAIYAGIHNNGFRGTVTVGEHSRVASRKVATRFGKKGQALKTGRLKIRGASHQVKSHQRKINMPKRQFIGNSQTLNKIINRIFVSKLIKIQTK